LPSGIDLVVAFIGAVAGTVLGQYIMQRLRGSDSPSPPAPRGRGSGRRGE
jgi:hypothetical protein